jgi:LSD1 subclass zinc finger protein
MKRGRNAAQILRSDSELNNSGDQERILILKAVPRSRKVQLMAQGAKEIRCMYCHQIRSLTGAVESEEGWVCDDCAPETMQELYYIGKRAGATDV